MAVIVGVFLALAVGVMSTVVGLDRDRALYPAVLIVVASCYGLFAVMAASTHALELEILVGAAFLAAAIIGFRFSLWVVVAGLAGHGVFDLMHGAVIANPGEPVWWPEFCSTYDVVAAAYLAWLIKSGRVAAERRPIR